MEVVDIFTTHQDARILLCKKNLIVMVFMIYMVMFGNGFGIQIPMILMHTILEEILGEQLFLISIIQELIVHGNIKRLWVLELYVGESNIFLRSYLNERRCR